jgi:hypothetical protein
MPLASGGHRAILCVAVIVSVLSGCRTTDSGSARPTGTTTTTRVDTTPSTDLATAPGIERSALDCVDAQGLAADTGDAAIGPAALRSLRHEVERASATTRSSLRACLFATALHGRATPGIAAGGSRRCANGYGSLGPHVHSRVVTLVVARAISGLHVASRGASVDRHPEAGALADLTRVDPVPGVELSQDVRDVHARGLPADEQRLRDLAVGAAAREVIQDLHLARREAEVLGDGALGRLGPG